ncbi:hypothetical protein [Sabulicella glaciei]|uniref:DUF4760 domain-containing protein n=1 Tax=Sabulicella glaciei TaxID=2984948 RepID=A0ABT3P1G9_9PROT|nr:hypothetical protein [Roseococcus sp. MDT2-1-1]MCW8088250.1 hypothetical protein [Roseococcus sp. MDT2-1-1]
MAVKIPDWLDVALKVTATLIAIFGVWSFFAQRAEAVRVAREERALAYIARFGGTDIVVARTALLDFWRRYPTFTAEARTRALSSREYEGFVAAAYPNDAARGEVDAALIRLLVFYDEVAFCHRAGTCDRSILFGYFCPHVTQHARVYRPFHALLGAAVGTDGLDRHLDELARSCLS